MSVSSSFRLAPAIATSAKTQRRDFAPYNCTVNSAPIISSKSVNCELDNDFETRRTPACYRGHSSNWHCGENATPRGPRATCHARTLRPYIYHLAARPVVAQIATLSALAVVEMAKLALSSTCVIHPAVAKVTGLCDAVGINASRPVRRSETTPLVMAGKRQV